MIRQIFGSQSSGLFCLLGVIVLFASCSRPIAEFAYSGEQMAPAKIIFENQSEKATRYVWDFGDGTTSEEASPTHRYRSSGNYLVKLKAMEEKKSKTKEKRIVIDAPEECLIEMETPYGSMIIRLFDATPQHQDNFVKLTEQGFYDSLLFHRVINGFMIQGGDPDSRNASAGRQLGGGGPGYTIPAEFSDTLVHIKGMLAAARTGDQVNPTKRSSGSQFYIVQGRPVSDEELNVLEARKGIRYSKEQREAYLELGGTPFLDREYTVFGQVIDGLEVIDKIAEAPTGGADRPREPVWMKVRLVK